MDMCYEGALVMPSNYAVMDEEEMTYVEGGAKKLVASYTAEQCNRMAAVACIAGGIVTAVAGVAMVVSAVATMLTCGATAAITAICAGIMAVAGGTTAAISGYLWLASTYNGMNVFYNTTTKGISVTIKK